MIQRYLGNKGKVLGPLLEVFAQHAEPGDHVVDLFSGSLTVSLAMKEAGYRVSANDANLLSHVVGQAFLVPSTVVRADLTLIPDTHRADLVLSAQARVQSQPGFEATREFGFQVAAATLGALVQWLNVVEPDDLPPDCRRSDVYDTYTEDGANSAFVSSRGTTGRRRFFSGPNARRIDLALGQIRAWTREGLDDSVRAYLLACLMRAVEKVANTQGTFHDFPRERWDQRALRGIQIVGLPTDPMISQVTGHRVGREEDSRDFIKSADHHSLLYLDPPYNFRQYSAYYFLLNLICRYPEISDLDDYFSKVTYVRGQNPNDDFTSTFCKASTFLHDMGTVMHNADCKTVVVSYYTGRNHWSEFDRGRNDTGLNLLRDLMTGSMFEPNSFEVFEVDRLNYASYGGYKARTVQELILVANKRRQSDTRGGTDPRVSEVA